MNRGDYLLSRATAVEKIKSFRLIEAGTYLWAAILVIVCLQRNYNFFYDDGFITLRYARHLAEGHGPVWNLVGAPVEGFTSPLHVLLVSALLAMHLNWLVALRVSTFFFHVVLIVFTWRFVRHRSGNLAAAIATALIAASWPMLVWDFGGLETVPFTALLAIGTLLTLRYAESRARRDILLGGTMLGLACFMSLLFSAGPWTRRRVIDLAMGIALFVLVVIPWEVFRIAYFHAWLPNTYYAKIYGIPLAWRAHEGWSYCRHFLLQPPYLVPLLLVAILTAVLLKKWTRFDLVLLLCIVAHALYIIDNGGDHMAAYRFMVPLIPLMAVSLAVLLQQVGALKSTALAATASCILLIASLTQAKYSPGYTPLNPRWRDPAGMMGEEFGRYINTHWKPGSTVAVKVAGSTPFFADRLTYIDILGLNDSVISRRNPVPMNGSWSHIVGHLKGDGQYVLDRRPDYILLGAPQGSLAGADRQPTLAEYEIMHLPAFAADYIPCEDTFELTPYGSSELGHFGHIAGPVHTMYYQRRDLPYPCKAPVR
jgi:hypothetical protein